MCDERTERAADEYQLRRSGMSRREFNAWIAATGAAALLPPVANAQEVSGREVLVETPDGTADNYFAHPSSGAHAGVIVWPDIRGNRPAFRAMGDRLAASGYSVLVANPFYRSAPSSFDTGTIEPMREHSALLSPETVVTDGRAFVEWLDRQPEVDSSRMMGSQGYCMSGSYPLRLAAAIPDRIGAGASFHGGRLVTDGEDSPHLLAERMSHAGFLIAISTDDDEEEPDVKAVLRETFDAAGVAAEIEVYADTLHGWCPPDSRVYHEEQAERAWSRLLALYGESLA